MVDSLALCAASVPVVGKDGELCWTALSSRSSRSRSDRLVPRAEVMAAEDESDDFCLFGKLDREKRERGRDAAGWTPPHVEGDGERWMPYL